MAKKKKQPSKPPAKDMVTSIVAITQDANLVLLKMDDRGILVPLFGMDATPAQLLELFTGVKLSDNDFRKVAVVEDDEAVITYYSVRSDKIKNAIGEFRLVPTYRLHELQVTDEIKWMVPMIVHDPYACVSIEYVAPVVDLEPSVSVVDVPEEYEEPASDYPKEGEEDEGDFEPFDSDASAPEEETRDEKKEAEA